MTAKRETNGRHTFQAAFDYHSHRTGIMHIHGRVITVIDNHRLSDRVCGRAPYARQVLCSLPEYRNIYKLSALHLYEPTGNEWVPLQSAHLHYPNAGASGAITTISPSGRRNLTNSLRPFGNDTIVIGNQY